MPCSWHITCHTGRLSDIDGVAGAVNRSDSGTQLVAKAHLPKPATELVPALTCGTFGSQIHSPVCCPGVAKQLVSVTVLSSPVIKPQISYRMSSVGSGENCSPPCMLTISLIAYRQSYRTERELQGDKLSQLY